ncbi:5,6-dimethylbenzimidazole synthase [Xylophilus rhododendri]|uniref:5,6-dimethylbenzimidazole synthase n=1 Tax=Xylophilus rhododendri TaxID=2697032 RepID=A0A857J5F3_9BURK|nr:5,6-dimethylbenzimidazole synthase [Xylophilus rhododendri]QHI98065.1 5,6-dimethylbenzimidazole synthase [Xylophilus rhododendri]
MCPADSADSAAPAATAFTAAERETLHQILSTRRDMRHFLPGQTVADEVLQRLLAAAHTAPSVGLMQPWRLLRIQDAAQRERIADLVEQERLATADCMGLRSDEFLALKVEGVREAALLLVAVLAPDDGTVFGRRTMPRDMALCSVACAIQNLWLAARVENLGMGWVSLFDPARLGAVLDLPEGAQAVAVLCIGPVPAFYPQPMLEIEGWRQGRALEEFVFTDRWPAG